MSQSQQLIIGLKGKAGSGKDTVADYLVEKHGFIKITFAYAVKEIVSILTGWPINLLMGDTPESRKFREGEVHPDFGLTGRQLLQKIGTDLFRDGFDSDTWIKIARRRVLESNNNVVISDVRFPNECEMIQCNGGYIINVQRNLSGLASDELNNHASEQNFICLDEVILENNSTISDLYQKIEALLG